MAFRSDVNSGIMLRDLFSQPSSIDPNDPRSIDLSAVSSVSGASEDLKITGLTHNSREVEPGSLFFAVRGSKFDGREFVADAVQRGCCAVVVDRVNGSPITDRVPVIVVSDVRESMAHAAARFHGCPSTELFTVGVTGTNGKTSVTWLISELLARLAVKTVHVGTLGNRVVDQQHLGRESLWRDGTHTTPDPIALQRELALAYTDGARAASIEASSHGIVQWRSAKVDWDSVIFTNLSHDHLDFHTTFEEYGEAKAQLFLRDLANSQKKLKTAIINLGDPWGCQILSRVREKQPSVRCLGFTTFESPGAEAMILRRRCLPHGSELDVRILGEEITLSTRLIGEYNAANVLAAVCCLIAHGHGADDVVQALREIETVPGRLELVAPAPISVYVDYAHTPDALLRAQSSLRELIGGRLITVFGCGGDRDRAKRSPMGKIAGELSDYTVLTSDNPRSESPEKIIEEILPGLRSAKGEQRESFRVIVDRREAIQHAIAQARDGDAVLIAGKGHEDYQEIGGIRHPFSDREACYETLAGLGYV